MFINLDYETFINIFHIYAGTNNLLCLTVKNDIFHQRCEFKMQSYFIAKSFILIELNFRAHGRYECLGSPWCSQRSSERTQWTQFYYTICIQTLSLPPAIFHHRDIIGAAETVSWITAVALVEVSFFMCIVCLLGFTTILKNPFFFLERERERKKKIFFQHVHVSTMIYT